MKKLFLFCSLILQVSLSMADEYIYPIANLDDETILMMHQKSLNDLELLSFNTQNNETQKLLSSLYFPAYVKIIPGKKKFSFIDRGRIYIKDFSKRTPRSLTIYQPILDIQSLSWINEQECIFSAKYKNHYKLFLYDLSKEGGTLYALCHLADTMNYIFPVCVDNTLFCLIQKDSSELYDIAKIALNPIVFEQSLFSLEQDFSIDIIPIEHKNSFCFLTMKDLQQGYIIEITEHNHQENYFVFSCCKLNLDQKSVSPLFTFQIPENFFIGMDENRFFESLYPLLPYYTDKFIYFTNYDNNLKKLILYQYNQNNQTISRFQPETKNIEMRHTFSPLMVKDKVYFGYNIETELKTEINNSK